MKENQGLKEANKGLDWLSGKLYWYVLSLWCTSGVHENALAKNINIHY